MTPQKTPHVRPWPYGIVPPSKARYPGFRYRVDQQGCWVWQGHACHKGYGKINLPRTRGMQGQQAHRYLWERWVGQIAEGMELDHLCYNRLCVRPGHLEVVTHRENCQRAAARRRQAKVAA